MTSPELAVAACCAGADAIGMMFYSASSRHLQIDQAAAISQAVYPLVTKIAVMVNPDSEYVNQIIHHVQPQMLQFHGEEDAAFCRRFGLPYVKAIRVADTTDLVAAESAYPDAAAILLDTWVNQQHGGTGISFDWKKANYGGAKKIILAGGLKRENISQAITQARPWAVDVSSGIETNGRKDEQKMIEFCNQVNTIN